ncbi:MAG: hypothetical protein ABS942_12630, partial [Solibacillus sp.]
GTNSVNLSKSVIKVKAFPNLYAATSSQFYLMVRFVSNSAVMVTRRSTGVALEFELEITEYESDVAIQSGTTNLSDGVARLSVPINSVNREKSELHFTFNTERSGEYLHNVIGTLESGTSINFARGTTSGLTQIQWFVVTHPS